MPARERFYPGTEWTIKDIEEVPEQHRGTKVVVLSELLQFPNEPDGSLGELYSWVYTKGEDPMTAYEASVFWFC